MTIRQVSTNYFNQFLRTVFVRLGFKLQNELLVNFSLGVYSFGLACMLKILLLLYQLYIVSIHTKKVKG